LYVVPAAGDAIMRKPHEAYSDESVAKRPGLAGACERSGSQRRVTFATRSQPNGGFTTTLPTNHEHTTR